MTSTTTMTTMGSRRSSESSRRTRSTRMISISQRRHLHKRCWKQQRSRIGVLLLCCWLLDAQPAATTVDAACTDACTDDAPSANDQRRGPWLSQTLKLLRAAHADGPQLRMIEAAMFGEWAIVDELVASSPVAACERTQSGALPLHLAVGHAAPPATVRLLFDAYPEGAKQKDVDGKCALEWGSAHSLARNESVPNNDAAHTLQALLEGFGRQVRSQGSQTRLQCPVHCNT